jgi:hypothetical protein
VGLEKQPFHVTGGKLWYQSLFNARYEYVLSVTGIFPLPKAIYIHYQSQIFT